MTLAQSGNIFYDGGLRNHINLCPNYLSHFLSFQEMKFWLPSNTHLEEEGGTTIDPEFRFLEDSSSCESTLNSDSYALL